LALRLAAPHPLAFRIPQTKQVLPHKTKTLDLILQNKQKKFQKMGEGNTIREAIVP